MRSSRTCNYTLARYAFGHRYGSQWELDDPQLVPDDMPMTEQAAERLLEQLKPLGPRQGAELTRALPGVDLESHGADADAGRILEFMRASGRFELAPVAVEAQAETVRKLAGDARKMLVDLSIVRASDAVVTALVRALEQELSAS